MALPHLARPPGTPNGRNRLQGALKVNMSNFLRKHSLSLALSAIFLGMMSLTLILGPKEWREERSLPEGAPVDADFWHWWVFQSNLSLVADVFGAIILVVFTKYLYESKSAEAKDPPEER